MKRNRWTFDKSDIGFEATRTKIESVSEFLECVQFKWDNWYSRSIEQWKPQEKLPWFRGVRDEHHELIPPIYREDQILWKYKAKDVVDMQAEFARRAKPFIHNKIPLNKGEYLHLMQHYGCPTRLLDWTEGALIALYFAIRIPKKRKTPCVWMLNPSWLNYVNDVTIENRYTRESKSLVLYTDCDAVRTFPADKIIPEQYLDEHNLAKFPVAVFPPHKDPRIVAQKSVFTIHGSDKNGFKSLLKKYTNDAQICMFRVSSNLEKIKNITTELNRLGITETTIFPDFEGLSREIQAEYGIFPQSSIPK